MQDRTAIFTLRRLNNRAPLGSIYWIPFEGVYMEDRPIGNPDLEALISRVEGGEQVPLQVFQVGHIFGLDWRVGDNKNLYRIYNFLQCSYVPIRLLPSPKGKDKEVVNSCLPPRTRKRAAAGQVRLAWDPMEALDPEPAAPRGILRTWEELEEPDEMEEEEEEEEVDTDAL